MKKKYGVIYESDIFDTPEQAAKRCEEKGTQLKICVFELGQEYEVERKTIVRRLIPKGKE